MSGSLIPLGVIDISSRPNRRKAVSRLIGVLGIIYAEEEAYMNRIPLSLHGGRAHSNADDSLYHLHNAIVSLYEAF